MIRDTFIIPIYNCQVDVVVAEHVEDIADEAGYHHDCDGFEGLTLSYPSNPSIYCVIFKELTVGAVVIAHEAYHLTAKVMTACDIKYDIDNIEPFAYLHGYIVGRLSDIITQHPV